jgi:decaprenyl-phosphate phosphoribosyltransferase
MSPPESVWGDPTALRCTALDAASTRQACPATALAQRGLSLNQDLNINQPVASPALATTPSSSLSALTALLRPRQWLKNGLVLLAPMLVDPAAVLRYSIPIALTLLAFTAAAAGVYVFNDLRDRERDRVHPVKRHRPLASKSVSVRAAIVLLALLEICTLAMTLRLPPLVGLVIAVYTVMNLWYCISLKHQALVDVCVVSTGFVLRALAGFLAAGVYPRFSLFICIYSTCLALSLGKRRHELARAQDDPNALWHRPALASYSVQFLDQAVVLTLVSALAGYVAFVWLDVRPSGELAAALTFPFAVFAVCRYLQMLTVQRGGGDPVRDLAKDRKTLVTCALWVAALVAGVML